MNRQVLVIDFEPHSLHATSAMLEDQGFDVLRAPSLVEIDRIVAQVASIPGLIVLEPMLPGLDGFKLCRTLKGLKQDGIGPVVLIGSKIFQGARYRTMARDAGADFFYKKPAENDLLIQALNRFAGTRRSATGAAPANEDSGPPAFESGTQEAVPPSPAPLSEETVFDAVGGLDIDEALSRVMDAPSPEKTPVPAHAAPIAAAATVGATPPAAERAAQTIDAKEDSSPGEIAMESSEDSPLDVKLTNLGETRGGRPTGANQGPDDDPLSLGTTLSFPARTEFGASGSVQDALPAAGAPGSDSPHGPLDEALPSPSVPEPASTPEEMEEAPQTGEQVLDDLLQTALTGSTESEINEEQSALVDARLEEIFSGALSGPVAQGSAAAEPPVPQPLTGMDPGTAELLSSLEELEHSIPQTPLQREDPTWNALPTGEAPPEIETSVPLKPPPRSPEQESLSQLLSETAGSLPLDSEQILTEIGPAGKLPAPASQPSAEPAVPNKSPDDVATPSKRLPILLASIVALVLVAGGIGIWLMVGSDGTTSPVADGPAPPSVPTQIAETEPDTNAPDAIPLEPESSQPAGGPVQPDAEMIVEPAAPAPPETSPDTARLVGEKRVALARARRELARATAALDDIHAAIADLSPESPVARLGLGPADLSPVALAIETGDLIGTPDSPPKFAPQIAGINGVSVPRLIASSRVNPKFPPLALRLGLTGKVVLQAVILRDGSVGEIEVLSEPRGRHGFGRAAKTALKQWKYEPAMRNGYPVDTYASVSINFTH